MQIHTLDIISLLLSIHDRVSILNTTMSTWMSSFFLISFFLISFVLSSENNINPWECDHWFHEVHSLDAGQNISDSVLILDGSVQIQFDIQINNNHCDEESNNCNLLSIVDTKKNMEVIALSLNPESDQLMIATTNNYNSTEIYSLSNISQILPPNQYNSFYLSFNTNGDKLLQINQKTHYSSIVHVSDVSNYGQAVFSSSSPVSLFVGNGMNSSNSIDGSIQNVCIVGSNSSFSAARSSTAPSNDVAAFCSENGESFDFAFFDSALHVSVYYSWSNDRYLQPIIDAPNGDYYYVISHRLDNVNHDNHEYVDAYCPVVSKTFGDLSECVKHWFVYNISLDQWINDEDFIYIYECAFCMTTSDTRQTVKLYATMQWYYTGFDKVSNGPQYVGPPPNGADFVPLIVDDDYSFYFLNTALAAYNASDPSTWIAYLRCHVGYGLPEDYIFDYHDITSCEFDPEMDDNFHESFTSNFTVSHTLYECNRLETSFSCFKQQSITSKNETMDINIWLGATAYWNDTTYLFQMEYGSFQYDTSHLLWENTDQTETAFIATRINDIIFTERAWGLNSKQWTQIQHKLYLMPFEDLLIAEINLLTKQTKMVTALSYIDIEYMAYVLALCSNDTHLFVVSKDYGISVYELSLGQWHSTSVDALYDFSCCEIVNSSKLYVFGGEYWNGTVADYDLAGDVTFTDEIYVYDTNADHMDKLNITLNEPASTLKSILVKNHYIYLYHGWAWASLFYIQIIDTRSNQIYYSIDFTFDTFANNVMPTAIVNPITNQFVAYSKNVAYYLQSDRISVHFDDTTVIPGKAFEVIELLQIDGCDIDSMNMFAADFLFESNTLSVNHKLVVKNGECNKICSGDEYGFCETCDNGIIPKIPSSIADSGSISVTLIEVFSDSSLEVFNDEFVVNINECPIAQGIATNAEILDCAECEENAFKLRSGNTDCLQCNADIGDSMQCHGADDVIINYNRWVGGVNNEVISIFEVDSDDALFGIQCPPNYCCMNENGCDLMNDFIVTASANDTQSFFHEYQDETGSLCAKYRDFDTPLCSKCIAGKYEMMGSTACGSCDDTNNMWYLVPIFIGAILFDIYLLHDASPINEEEYTAKELDHKKLLQKDEMRALTVMVTKISVYYYQSLAQILSSKGVSHALLPILTIFSFSFDQNYGSSASPGFCLIPFIDNGLDEIFLSAIFVIFCGLNFIWMSFTIFLYHKVKTNKDDPDANESKHKRIGMALLKLVTITAGTLLDIGFKLVSCVIFPNGEAVHYYNSTRTCFDGYLFGGLCIVAIATIAFVAIFIRIYKQKQEERQSHRNVFRKIILIYVPSAWWMEFVLFSRRFIIALLSSNRVFQERQASTVLSALLVVYLCIQVQVQPFKYLRLNILECICLFALISILNAVQGGDGALWNDVYIAFMILVPFMFMIYNVFMILRIIYITKKDPNTFSGIELRKLKTASLRSDVPIKDAENAENGKENDDDQEEREMETRKYTAEQSDDGSIGNCTETQMGIQVTMHETLHDANEYENESVSDSSDKPNDKEETQENSIEVP
eukprot:87461_1